MIGKALLVWSYRILSGSVGMIKEWNESPSIHE